MVSKTFVTRAALAMLTVSVGQADALKLTLSMIHHDTRARRYNDTRSTASVTSSGSDTENRLPIRSKNASLTSANLKQLERGQNRPTSPASVAEKSTASAGSTATTLKDLESTNEGKALLQEKLDTLEPVQHEVARKEQLRKERLRETKDNWSAQKGKEIYIKGNRIMAYYYRDNRVTGERMFYERQANPAEKAQFHQNEVAKQNSRKLYMDSNPKKSWLLGLKRYTAKTVVDSGRGIMVNTEIV